MSERSVVHATIVVERAYDAPPARVFAAWADPAVKVRWFAGMDGDGWEAGPYALDFRVGGRERSSGRAPNGSVYTYDALYQDIVPDRRIVLTYEMHQDQSRVSVSLETVEFEPTGAGTRLIVTEQGAFLDGLDTPDQRRQGTGSLLEALGEELRRQAPDA